MSRYINLRAALLTTVFLAAANLAYGQDPFSCICTDDSHDDCINGYCNITDPRFRGCRISAQYFNLRFEDPFIYVTHTCLREIDLVFYYSICNNGVGGPIFLKTLSDYGDAEICCINGSNCNTPELYSSLTRTEPTYVPTTETPAPAYSVAVISALSILVVIILIVIVFALCYCNSGCHMMNKTGPSGTPTVTMTFDSGSYGDLYQSEIQDDSGSGSGLPLIVQRSIARQVSLHEKIGKGRFGEVWKGSLKDDEVAVKIFHPKEELSWYHEVNIYQTCLLRHPNILRFIAADNIDTGTQTQLWLITEFCEYGSLYDILRDRVLTEELMLKLCYTAACGLDHLHSEIVGTECTQSKPMIAHRDLKSRNILVKGDFSCCIADLGLSLSYDHFNDNADVPPTIRVGTNRYLAPEIIDESIGFRTFNSFKMADMYSFGLVLWEIATRGECGGHAEEPELPYHDVVPALPTFEDMKKAIVIDMKRPVLPNRWSESEVYLTIGNTIEHCWHQAAESRVAALRVKKNLGKLWNNEKIKKQEQS